MFSSTLSRVSFRAFVAGTAVLGLVGFLKPTVANPGAGKPVTALVLETPAPTPAPAPPPLPEPPAPARVMAVDYRIAGQVEALRPEIKLRLARAVKRLPEQVTLLVTSAYRTYDEQAALQPTFGVKAKPGTSAHEDGRAIDVNVLVDWQRISPSMNEAFIGDAMASEGFKALGPSDPVHYSVPVEELTEISTEWVDLEVLTPDQLAAQGGPAILDAAATH